jgi:hypothetical protein
MPHRRLGELLAELVPISDHDIEEILHEQATRNLRFGEIAIAMGLCGPEHVWRAWCRQAVDEIERVDLEAIGIDAQATLHLPRELALRYSAVPLRRAGGQLIIATSPQSLSEAAAELPRVVSKNIKFVLANAEQVQLALQRYYGSDA